MAKKIITAIDVGSSKISTVISQVGEDEVASVIGVANYPSKGIKKGVIINLDEAINSISESLEAAERMAGVTVSTAIVSIGGKQITSTNNKGVVAVSHEEITAEDVARALESAKAISIPPSKEILHVIPREFIIDSQGGIRDPIGMSGIRLEVDTHIISTTTTVLHNLLKCIGQVGLNVSDVVFAGWASANVVLTNTEKELGVLLLDIGAGTTNIVIYNEEAICYSGSIPLGGSNITSDIAIGLRLTIEDAEKLKVEISTLIKNAKIRRQREKEEEKSKSRIMLRSENKRDEDEKSSSKKKREDDEDASLLLKLSDIGIESSSVEDIPKSLFDEVVEARLEELFKMVELQVQQAGYEVKMPAGVVLTGGGAKLNGIVQVAQKYMNIPARVGYGSGLIGLTDEISGPAYSVSQGLTYYGINNESSQKGSAKQAGSNGNGVGKLVDWIKGFLP